MSLLTGYFFLFTITSSIEQEKELKPVSDEMLEYAAESLGINLTLPRETNVKILNEMFSDPEVALKSLRDVNQAIEGLDDHIGPVQDELFIECAVNKEKGEFKESVDCTKWASDNAKGVPLHP